MRLAGETHVGMRRQHNEDALHLPVGERLCLVADGMGGHASGEVASKLAIDTIVDYFRETAADASPTWPFPVDWGTRGESKRLGAAILLANLRILEESRADQRYQGMGTTIVAAYFGDSGVFFAHVGDSRIYRLRNGALQQLTEDHSLFSEYVKLGRAQGNEENFPQKNVLVRALGMRDSVHVDIHPDQIALGDVYLLCTDGLCGLVPDETLRSILLQEQDLHKACDRLIAAANAAGGPDNITVAIARVEDL